MLEHFVFAYREEIIRACRKRMASRAAPPPTCAEMRHGVPLCLDHLITALRVGLSSPPPSPIAAAHGHDRLPFGLTPSQVVHGYGDLYRAITEMATDKRIPISADDFRLLNQCLNEVIAAAVAGDEGQRDRATSGGEAAPEASSSGDDMVSRRGGAHEPSHVSSSHAGVDRDASASRPPAR
jgi:hypothetical protein